MTEGELLTAAVTGGRLPQSLRLNLAGRQIHCLLWGSANDPLALLVHGNGGHAHWWDALVPALVPGWRLVVPDLRGHGESDWAELPQYGIDDFAADLIAVLDALASERVQGSEEPRVRGPEAGVVLIGHSMGGRIAAWLAIHHPQRARGLVMLDSRLGPIKPEIAQRYRGRIAGQREGRGYATREDAIAAFRFVPDERHVAPAIVTDLAYHAVTRRAAGDWTFRFDRGVLSLDGDRGGDLVPLLDRIRCPVTVMGGEHSWVLDEGERAAITRMLPRARIRTFPGAHHFLLSHPEPVGQELRSFLDRLP